MATGWAFLVAAGRHRDFRILLAPEFLVTSLDYGVLDEVARPGVVQLRTGAGRRLCVVSATHPLTAADLDGSEPRDEHGRPLRLIYGFVSPDGPVLEPDGTDLRHALSTALDVYRGYLVDEDRVTVAASVPYALRSRTTGWPVSAPPAARQRPVRLLVGAAALAAVAVLAIGAGLGQRPEAPEPTDSPSAPASGPVVRPSPSTRPSPSAPESPAGRRRRGADPLLRSSPIPDQSGTGYLLRMVNR